jgi:hypoxanthine-guanine phosphoribosyltransferase
MIRRNSGQREHPHPALQVAQIQRGRSALRFCRILFFVSFFTGNLLPQLTFPLEFDYIHVTRYGDEDRGGKVVWKVIPRQRLLAMGAGTTFEGSGPSVI